MILALFYLLSFHQFQSTVSNEDGDFTYLRQRSWPPMCRQGRRQSPVNIMSTTSSLDGQLELVLDNFQQSLNGGILSNSGKSGMYQ